MPLVEQLQKQASEAIYQAALCDEFCLPRHGHGACVMATKRTSPTFFYAFLEATPGWKSPAPGMPAPAVEALQAQAEKRHQMDQPARRPLSLRVYAAPKIWMKRFRTAPGGDYPARRRKHRHHGPVAGAALYGRCIHEEWSGQTSTNRTDPLPHLNQSNKPLSLNRIQRKR